MIDVNRVGLYSRAMAALCRSPAEWDIQEGMLFTDVVLKTVQMPPLDIALTVLPVHI